MKKLSTILFIAVFALTACAQTPKTAENTDYPESKIDWDNIEVVQRIGEFAGYSSLSGIKENVDLIVEAEVINEMAERHIISWTYDNFGNIMPDIGGSIAELRVSKVFQGDVKKGDVIKMGLNYFIAEANEGGYGIDRPRLITSSDMTPLRNGEKWLFIITQSGVAKGFEEAYFLNGDTSGKFPVPDEKKLDVVKKFNENKAKIDEYMLSVKKTAKIVPEEKLSEYDSKTASGEILGKMVYDETGSYIVSDEQYKKITSLWQEQDDLRFSLNPDDYGIRNIGYFNMDLYADICGEFYGNG